MRMKLNFLDNPNKMNELNSSISIELNNKINWQKDIRNRISRTKRHWLDRLIKYNRLWPIVSEGIKLTY